MQHRKKRQGSKVGRSAKVNIGAKRRATPRKAAAPAPLLDSRLKKAARIAFHLMGED